MHSEVGRRTSVIALALAVSGLRRGRRGSPASSGADDGHRRTPPPPRPRPPTTETEQEPPEAETETAPAETSPEDQPGGAGDEEPIGVNADFSPVAAERWRRTSSRCRRSSRSPSPSRPRTATTTRCRSTAKRLVTGAGAKRDQIRLDGLRQGGAYTGKVRRRRHPGAHRGIGRTRPLAASTGENKWLASQISWVGCASERKRDAAPGGCLNRVERHRRPPHRPSARTSRRPAIPACRRAPTAVR